MQLFSCYYMRLSNHYQFESRVHIATINVEMRCNASYFTHVSIRNRIP